MFSRTPARPGKTTAIRSSARILCSGMGTFFPAAKRSTARKREAFHRQRVVNMGEAKSACVRTSRALIRMEKGEDHLQRKAVLLAERKKQTVVGGRGLQSKVEGTAETLPQGQPPGAVQASAERRMDDELHPAAFIEESLGHDVLARRSTAQGGASRRHVSRGLFGGDAGQSALLLKQRMAAGS